MSVVKSAGMLLLAAALGCAGARPVPRVRAPTPGSVDADAIDAYVQQQVRDLGLVGLSLAVMNEGKVILAKGYGVRSLRTRSPVDAETLFAVGSVTKQLTAASILLLAEDGKLSVQDPVAKYYPSLTRAHDITLLDLMNHVSGYPDYYPLDFLDRRMLKPIAAEEIIREYAGGPLDFEPGTRWSYSNTGYIILGRVVEKVSGEPLAAFMARRIFKPLGMEQTRYEPDADEPGLAQGYLSIMLSPPETAVSEAKQWLAGAGGVWSTASDLARWDLALATGQVLKPESFRLFTTPRRLANGATTRYGCGVGVREAGSALLISHRGAVNGFGANNTVMPASRAAVVLLFNSDAYDAQEGLSSALVKAIMWPPGIPRVDGPPALVQARTMLRQMQTGQVDRSRIGEEFSIFLSEERLRGAAARLGPFGEPEDADVVRIEERGGMEVSTVQFKFKSGALEASMYRKPDGRVEQFLVSKQ